VTERDIFGAWFKHLP